jgi:hypothetical protein
MTNGSLFDTVLWNAGKVFDGPTFDQARDGDRLNAQLGRVLAVLKDHRWHTLGDISSQTHDPQASISARIRDLRKARYGGHEVKRRYVERGLWEYKLGE